MVRSLAGARDYLSLKRPDVYWSYTIPPIQRVVWTLSGGLSGKGVKKMMTHCSVVPRVRMSGDTYPHHIIPSWCAQGQLHHYLH